MTQTIFLDTGPLGIITNPRKPAITLDALRWAASHVLIAAQALDYQSAHQLTAAGIVVATVNVGHLFLFVRADVWQNIHP